MPAQRAQQRNPGQVSEVRDPADLRFRLRVTGSLYKDVRLRLDEAEALGCYQWSQEPPFVIADPLAPENILKSSGRGIFLIRNFSGRNRAEESPGGGMEIRMVKKLQKTGRDPPSRFALRWPAHPGRARRAAILPFVSMAIEAVVRAGDLQIAKFGTGVRIDKRGAIDLVTKWTRSRARFAR